jgi:hypothetical protein
MKSELCFESHGRPQKKWSLVRSSTQPEFNYPHQFSSLFCAVKQKSIIVYESRYGKHTLPLSLLVWLCCLWSTDETLKDRMPSPNIVISVNTFTMHEMTRNFWKCASIKQTRTTVTNQIRAHEENKSRLTSGHRLLSFGIESTVFQFTLQKHKDEDIKVKKSHLQELWAELIHVDYEKWRLLGHFEHGNESTGNFLTIGGTISFSRSTLLHGVSNKYSWLRWLHDILSPRKTQFDPRAIYFDSVVGKWQWAKCFSYNICFLPSVQFHIPPNNPASISVHCRQAGGKFHVQWITDFHTRWLSVCVSG